jgi:hypothetical protein
VRSVRPPLTYDDIEGIERAPTPGGHREAAAVLQAWAEEQHPDDEVGVADLLSAAAWHRQQAGDVEECLALHRSAAAAGDTTQPPTARVQLHAALVAAGRLDEARQVAAEIRRSRPGLGEVGVVAETFELAGDLREATRWVAMGLDRLDLDADFEDDLDAALLLDVRRRVRQAVGFPPDELDRLGRG